MQRRAIPDEREGIGPDPIHHGLDYGQRDRGGHRCVGGVASFQQHSQASLCRERL